MAGPMALSTAIGGLTLGLAPAGADVVVNHAAENSLHTIASNPDAIKIAAHMALDGAGTVVEHKHGQKHHRTALQKLKDSAAVKGKMVQTSQPNSNPLYSATPGMLPSAGFTSYISGTPQGLNGTSSPSPLPAYPFYNGTQPTPNAAYSPQPPPAFPVYNAGAQPALNTPYSLPPPPGYPAYTAESNQGRNDTRFYSRAPGSPFHGTDTIQGSKDPQIYSQAPGISTYGPDSQQGLNCIPFFAPPPAYPPNAAGTQQYHDGVQSFAPPPSNFPYALGIQQGHNGVPYFPPPPGTSTLAGDQQGTGHTPSSGYHSYTAGVRQGLDHIPFSTPPFGQFSSYYPPTSDAPQNEAKEVPAYAASSGYSPYNANVQQWPNNPPQMPASDYFSHATGVPQALNGAPLPPPPSGYPLVGFPQGIHGIPVTLAHQPNPTPAYEYSYEAGSLAPPAYDVHEVSDDDDDAGIAEIEALLRDLKASKAARESKGKSCFIYEDLAAI